jgi:hypothetical protein
MSSTYRSRGKILFYGKIFHFLKILEPIRHQPSPRMVLPNEYQLNDQQIKARQQTAHV